MRTIVSTIFALLLVVPPGAWAGETAVLTGRVLPSPDGGPTAKTVWVGAVPATVAPDGSFRADGIPGGSTELAIETSEGLYLVATPVAIAPGTTRSLQLAFRGRQDSNALPPSEKEKKKSRGGVWANPVSATLIVVGAAIVVGIAVDQLTKSDSIPVSPSTN